MITLDQAIQHHENRANEIINNIRDTVNTFAKCYDVDSVVLDDFDKEELEIAESHQNIACYLKLLKQICESGDCNSCKRKGYCDMEPKLGELVRYNCYYYIPKEDHK